MGVLQWWLTQQRRRNWASHRLVAVAPLEQELVGLIPPLGSILRRVKPTMSVPLTFHGHLHNVQDHCEGTLSAPECAQNGVEVDEPSAPGKD
jgi:hypothetical protein